MNRTRLKTLEWRYAEAEAESSNSAPGEKQLTLINGIALIVGLQIGSGIFSSPGVIVAHTQSASASLVIWVIAALLAWTGASSFAELGASLPRNGGAQAYLAYTYGPLVSYLFTWTAILLLSPGTKAVNSLVFAEYLNRVLWNATRGDDAPSEIIPNWVINTTAVAVVIFVVILVVGTRSLGPRAAVILTCIKVLALLSVIVLGFMNLFLGRDTVHPYMKPATEPPPTVASYAQALYAGLWAFDGFNQANYVAGEMRHPARDIPRAIHLSMGLVAVLFFFANVAYFSVLDRAAIARSNTVALDFGWALFGRAGGMFFALVVALSCLGVLTGSLFTSARVIYAAARNGQLPRTFGVLDEHRGTPVRAVLLQAAFVIALIFLGGGFRALVRIAVVALWGFYFLTVFAVIILRVREPDLPRPYRTWIITPLTFCAVTIFLLCVPAVAAPRETLVVVCADYMATG
ncbi:APC amino acid permease [Multifurca ochricompacta]|uniref:APC amino acid permease n=1 Tax=Multifurca ochricompacta TaxID=376703 RepID=A0AAD4QLZ0_9AGAM|nr:APC amino acid permease [Multifurca ochricompacta]